MYRYIISNNKRQNCTGHFSNKFNSKKKENKFLNAKVFPESFFSPQLPPTAYYVSNVLYGAH